LTGFLRITRNSGLHDRAVFVFVWKSHRASQSGHTGWHGFDMVEAKMGQVKAADEVSQIRIPAIIDEELSRNNKEHVDPAWD
jgi:hypothetical protein